MIIVVHADDLGLSEDVTDAILQTHDRGVLTSASVIANGEDVARAVDAARERPTLSLRLHLNLTQGTAIAPAADLHLLATPDGTFRYSFVSLWARYVFAGRRTRRGLRAQVLREFSAQIESYRSRVGEHYPLCVDGHHHSHMIPFVFGVLLQLHDIHEFSYVRIPREKFFFSGESANPWKTYFGSNLIKHFLLNVLGRSCSREAIRAGIATCDYFVGVLFTGRMTLRVCEAAMAGISPSASKASIVEILFHPSRVVGEGTNGSPSQGTLENFPDSSREKETAELLRPEFKRLLPLWSGQPASGLR